MVRLLANEPTITTTTTTITTNTSLAIPLLAQIHNLVNNLNKKNSKSTLAEIYYLIEPLGSDYYQYFLKCLFENINFEEKEKDKDKEAPIQAILLGQEIGQNFEKPDFYTFIQNLFLGLEPKKLSDKQLLSKFSRLTKLNPVQSLLIAITFYHSSNPSLKTLAIAFLKEHLEESIRFASQKPLPSVTLIHKLLAFFKSVALFASPTKEAWLKESEPLVNEFIELVQSHFQSSIPIILEPFLFRTIMYPKGK
jgi:hypothetical protein